MYGDGMGGTLEEKITVESEMMIQRLTESEKKPVDVRLMMGKIAFFDIAIKVQSLAFYPIIWKCEY